MKLLRRQFLHLAGGAAALPGLSRIARAQAYPTRPVRIVVTFPPGGANDIHARLFGQLLSERLGQPFVVENRPGGGGNVGTLEVVRSAPDGHTLLLISVGLSINAVFYQNLPYDLVRDLSPIAAFFRSSYVMLVNPSLPAKTLPEFVAHAKANPGKLNFGSNGVGATGHLAGEMFKMMTGVNMLHVPYRGETPALGDLMGGAGARDVRDHDLLDSARARRTAARFGGDLHEACAGPTRGSDCQRLCSGLRTPDLGWNGRAREYALGRHQPPEQGGQCRAHAAGHQGEI